MILLTSKFIDKFEEDGYVSWEAPRKSGKTSAIKGLIHHLIADGECGDIAVITPNFAMLETYKTNFGKKIKWYGSCTEMGGGVHIQQWMNSMLLSGLKYVFGDEVYIPKYHHFRIACAYTFYPGIMFKTQMVVSGLGLQPKWNLTQNLAQTGEMPIQVGKIQLLLNKNFDNIILE